MIGGVVTIGAAAVTATPRPALAAVTATQLAPPVAAATPLPAREQTFVDAAARAAHAVARVTDVSLPRANASAGPGQAIVGVPQGNGSGVIVDAGGGRRLLATNYHVLAASLEKQPPNPSPSGDESKQPKVALVTFYSSEDGENGQPQRRTFDGFLVGYDRARDLAVLRVGGGATELPPPLEVAPASSLRVGQAVLAVGSPFGFDGSVSAGVVSALGVAIPSLARQGATLTGCVAFDAAANPGSSGGALVDSTGRLVGMPTAIFTPTGVSAGQGFAIPAEAVVKAAASLASGARVTGAGLGIVVASEAVKARLGVSAVPGALLQAARPGGAADRAGLKATRREASGVVAGDTVSAVDGRAIAGATDLAAVLAERMAGETVRLTVVKGGGGGKTEEVEAVLDDE
jgi:S1-C subfamily serine protease